MSRLVHLDTTRAHQIFLCLAAAAPQDRLHPSHQDLRAERFGNILIYAQAEPVEFIPLLALGRQHNDGHLGILPDLLHHLPAVHPGHHHVQNDQIHILFFKKHVHRFHAVPGLQHRIALFHKEILHQLAHTALIIHNKNLTRIHLSFLPVLFCMYHHNSHFPCLMQLCSYHDSIQLSSYAFILT